MGYGIYNVNYSYWGGSKPTNITGGPHIVVNGLINYKPTYLGFAKEPKKNKCIPWIDSPVVVKIYHWENT